MIPQNKKRGRDEDKLKDDDDVNQIIPPMKTLYQDKDIFLEFRRYKDISGKHWIFESHAISYFRNCRELTYLLALGRESHFISEWLPQCVSKSERVFLSPDGHTFMSHVQLKLPQPFRNRNVSIKVHIGELLHEPSHEPSHEPNNSSTKVIVNICNMTHSELEKYPMSWENGVRANILPSTLILERVGHECIRVTTNILAMPHPIINPPFSILKRLAKYHVPLPKRIIDHQVREVIPSQDIHSSVVYVMKKPSNQAFYSKYVHP